MSQDADVRLMFLASKRFESGKAIRGAFLLSDLNTKPCEFRCTNPIRPTSLQSMLYGDTLEEHIMIELIGLPLTKSLKQVPQLLLVQERVFLGLRSRIEIPVILIAKEEEIPVIPAAQENPGHLLHSSSGKFDPVVLIPHPKFTGDREQAKTLLSTVFEGYNLAEPFNRIALALDQVHAQKIGEEK